MTYQTELIGQFDDMISEYKFVTVDARKDPQAIQPRLRKMVRDYLHTTNYRIPDVLAGTADPTLV